METNDNFDKPLTVITANTLVQFLNTHKGIRLQVVDATQQLASSNEDDGVLMVGTNETLQAKFGMRQFGIPLHPGRFKLDAPSLRTYRDIIRAEALRAAKVVDLGDDERPSHASGVNRYGYGYGNVDHNAAEKKLRRELEAVFVNATLVYIDGSEHRAFVVNRKANIIDDLRRLAIQAGFTKTDFKIGGMEFVGVWGTTVGHLLTELLEKADEGKKALRLRQTDSYGAGPWVIIFNVDDTRLIIGNRQFAEEHKARFLT